MSSFLDNTLDALIAPGFSRIGYALRSSKFRNLSEYSLAGKSVVITGPTSGIGEAVAEQLAGMNTHLILVGRSPEKLNTISNRLMAKHSSLKVDVVVADMGDLSAVRAASDQIAQLTQHIHALVHNAGALLNERAETPQGQEVTVATHVLGPHLMTTLLLAQLRVAHGRVVTVSSGGMYGATLTDISKGQSPEMTKSNYNGTRQYAIAKRMQVTLNEMWAAREPDVVFSAMHPGWADTPGVQQSLPTFRVLTKPLLRSAAQGADTISWLVADDAPTQASGKFWCDREPRPIHRLGKTKKSDTPAARDALWAWCNEQIAAYTR